jgi:hypothetical protein
MADVRIVDIRDAEGFARIPPCADPGFDHRSCDYWEDADRGSKAARLSWWDPSAAPAPAPRPASANPFADEGEGPIDNPFAPRRDRGPAIGADQPRKLQLLGRGLAIFGTYAKVLEVDGAPAVYAQFGPLSAYPRAQRVRELYPRLPQTPLPAVITCIAATASARGAGHAGRLIGAICDDLATRGFAAVEAYPDPRAREDATSAATAAFWLGCGFVTAVEDERFPVMRHEL